MRRTLEAPGAKILPFDLNDPLLDLYLPLWYPYSDMDGANCYSYDKNRRTCPVTTAVWGTTGRTFNIVDYISPPLSAHTPPRTFIIWVKTDSLTPAGTRYILDNTPGAAGYMIRQDAGGNNIIFYVYFTVAGLQNSVVNIPDLNFHMITAIITTTGERISLDTGAYVEDVIAADTVVDPADTVEIGTQVDALGNNGWDGMIGEVIIFNREITIAERNDIYDATKWRYV